MEVLGSFGGEEDFGELGGGLGVVVAAVDGWGLVVVIRVLALGLLC